MSTTIGIGAHAYSNPVMSGTLEVPQTIAAVQNWFRSDLGVTESGGNVTAWADQIGSGNLVAGTAPAYTASDTDINNLPSINFDGASSEYLEDTSLNITAGMELYYILARTNVAAGGRISDATSVINGHAFYNRTDLFYSLYAGALVSGAYILTNDVWERTRVYWADDTTAQLQTNTNTATGDPGTVSGTGLRLGASGGVAANYGYFDIAEIVICSSKLSAGDNSTLDTYFNDRYGVTVS